MVPTVSGYDAYNDGSTRKNSRLSRMLRMMNNILKAANFIGFFLYRRYAKGMHWKASRATVTAITPYISGPRMCTIDYSKTKIRLTYSKQTLDASH